MATVDTVVLSVHALVGKRSIENKKFPTQTKHIQDLIYKMQGNEIGITILPKVKIEIQSVNDQGIVVGVVELCKLDCVAGSMN